MGFDSANELLFKIGADPSEAQNNIARFRTLLSKDLGDLKAEFDSWSQKVLGNLTTVTGATTAGAAALGAAVVAIGAYASAATDRYAAYVDEVGRGSKVTGIAVEQMSGLRFAAEETGTSWDAVTRGLGFFASAVVKANAGGKEQAAVFQRMGITQKDVAAGEQNLYPLLEKVTTWFHNSASGTERAAIARDLFSRGGTEMLGFLKLGSDGLRHMTEEAEKLGLTLTSKDVVAVKEYKASLAALEAQHKAMDVELGRSSIAVKLWWEEAKTAFSKSWWDNVQTVMKDGMGGLAKVVSHGGIFGNLKQNFDEIDARVKETARLLTALGDQKPEMLAPPEGKAKKTTEEFYGLSEVLGQVRSRMASATDEEARNAAQIVHLQEELAKARVRYVELQKEGKLTADDALREAAAFARMPQAIAQLTAKLAADLAEKRKVEADQAEEDIQRRMNSQRERGFDEEQRQWNEEVAKLRTIYEKKKELTAEMEGKIADLKRAGDQRIQREQTDAFVVEMGQLQAHLAQILQSQMTTRERLDFEHDQELKKFDEVELAKTEAYKAGGWKRQQIEANFQMMREAINGKYARDLQSLVNSQGWQGVFGNHFASSIRQNEALLKEWATSAQQSHLMVKMAMQDLKETGEQTFESFAQAEGQGIASAIVYSKSISEAMRSAAASTLESVAAKAFVEAIYSTAYGFLLLAEGDLGGAASAFEAAAIFATVGGAAAVAGRAIAPKQGGATSSSVSNSNMPSGAGTSSGGSFTGSGVGSGGPHVTVNVYGHVIGPSGAGELCDMINDAVLNSDHTLTATNTKTGVQVVR